MLAAFVAGAGYSSVRTITIIINLRLDSYTSTVEGAITMFVSIIVVFILPNWPANTKWLTEEEKGLAAARIKADHVGSVEQRMKPLNSTLSALADWRTYMFTFMYM